MARVIVLDTGVVIGYLDPEDTWHDRAAALIETLGEDGLAMSALTLAECLVRPVQRGEVSRFQAALRRVGITVRPLHESDAGRVAEVRAATRLRMPDAIVVHSAEQLNAAVATTDVALARAAEGRGIPTFLISE